MTPSARFQAVLELLDSLDKVHRPADALVSGYFRARRYIGSKDRAFIAETFYDVLRQTARLSWWIDRVGGQADARSRLIAYLILGGKEPKTVTELFSGGKFAPAALTDDEKKMMRQWAGHTLEHPDMPDTVLGECPEWAAAWLQKRFGKSFLKEMRAMMAPATLDLRLNPLKGDRQEILQKMKAQGLEVEATPYSPWGLRLKARMDLTRIPLLKDGTLEIQDEGSQLIALLLDAKPGERVVDFCAGAGGKTLALAAAMANKGRITACDILETRLRRSLERFKKAGFHNIEIKPLSTERDPWVKRHKESFDRVLVDAPCSGSGTWRRNPDSRWRPMGPGMDQLTVVQASILESAARLVKPGGRLVYATCSLLPVENEEQIEKFLAFHPDFSLTPMAQANPTIKTLPTKEDCLKLSPGLHQTDGFFAAVMDRSLTPKQAA